MLTEKYTKDIQSFFKYARTNTERENLTQKIRNSRKVLIYGAGSGGKYAKYLLSLINIHTSAFLDCNAENIKEVDGIKVYLPDAFIGDEKKDEVFIIIGVGSPNAKIEIEKMLLNYGYKNTISYIELFNEAFLMADEKMARDIDFRFFIENKEDIIKAATLFADDKSLSIYSGFVKGHALNNKDYFAKPDLQHKYFPEDVPLNKGYKCFIDCGASTGETFEILEKRRIIPKKIIMFEPDKYNFTSLSIKMRSKEQEAILYPCAVYSKTGFCKFSHSSTQGSSITSNSSEFVQCVALDEILVNIKPTFIKMDIEGSEYEALLGAKSTICESKPDLAICVYHAINHIWDIPIFLNSLNLGYKMYLRSGNFYGMNTVLYATAHL